MTSYKDINAWNFFIKTPSRWYYSVLAFLCLCILCLSTCSIIKPATLSALFAICSLLLARSLCSCMLGCLELQAVWRVPLLGRVFSVFGLSLIASNFTVFNYLTSRFALLLFYILDYLLKLYNKSSSFFKHFAI